MQAERRLLSLSSASMQSMAITTWELRLSSTAISAAINGHPHVGAQVASTRQSTAINGHHLEGAQVIGRAEQCLVAAHVARVAHGLTSPSLFKPRARHDALLGPRCHAARP